MAGPLGHGAPMPQEMYGYDELGSTLTHPSQPIPSGNDYGLHAVPRHLQPGYVPSNQDPQAGWQNFHYGPNPHEVYDGQIPHAEVAQQPMGQAQPQANVIDDQVLLLHLAESYLGLARQYASDRTSNRQTLDLKHYYKLIAFSLACLRSVMLKSSRWHLHPHREAMVRLKYANILYEETENNTEAEEALTKGVCHQPSG
ncbi:MAG: hypothetical protein M1823_002722 [Watsoniomyces obsoletus]|nr:MAG: hypothetical protein M1823_002722 [Watsoniomyces obsoletus]